MELPKSLMCIIIMNALLEPARFIYPLYRDNSSYNLGESHSRVWLREKSEESSRKNGRFIHMSCLLLVNLPLCARGVILYLSSRNHGRIELEGDK